MANVRARAAGVLPALRACLRLPDGLADLERLSGTCGMLVTDPDTETAAAGCAATEACRNCSVSVPQ